ncbi:hypothetical protein GLP37_06140 [Photobacterium phosphoreum]|uniref:hypothetical protein n=1 Tax=Photobacterium phosphoreum TaxID=659 RepID=UPI001E391C5B|nr:hypothetical protein [Photobacterium phosphoreum]MCD9501752.1 hypothetical protein [Photobacterium phosphoreum]
MDVGGAGEDFFSGLCKAADITPNRSFECDANGWDHYIEFLSSGEALSKPLFEAKIQVKSTLKKNNFVQIDLQNMLKLSTYRYPSFIIYLKFIDGSPTPYQMYIKHIDEIIIESVFDKVSKVRSERGQVNLRKHKMNVKFSEDELILNINGTALKERLETLVKTKIKYYIKNKSDFLDRLEKKHNKISLYFNVLEPDIDIMQNAFLGFGEPITIRNLSISTIDLGLKEKDLSQPSEDASIIVIHDYNEKESAVLTFSGGIKSPKYNFICKFINSPINSFVPKEKIKVRFENKFFDILMNIHSCTLLFSFKITKNEAYDIDELYKALYLAHDLDCLSVFNKLTISLGKQQIKIRLPRFELGLNFEYELARLETIKYIKNDVKDFDQNIKISLNELSAISERVSFIQNLLDKKALIRLEFTSNNLKDEHPIASIFFISLGLPDVSYCYVAVILGRVKYKDDDRYQLITNDISIIDSLVIKDEIVTDKDLIPLIEEYEKNYIDTHNVVRQESFLV